MKTFLHNVAERVKSRLQGRTLTEYEIASDEVGVRVQWRTMENDQGSVSFAWESVVNVDTFKRDFFSVDCICLAFETSEGWIETNEDMKGWQEFLASTESHLAGFPSLTTWYRKVMLPAFEANHTRVWERGSVAQNQSTQRTTR